MKRVNLFLPLPLFLSVLLGQSPWKDWQWVDTFPVYDLHLQRQLAYPWTGGIQTPIISPWDWTGDSIPDLIIYDRDVHRFLFFVGTDSFSPTSGLRVYRFADRVHLALDSEISVHHYAFFYDVNGDGKPELWTALSDIAPLEWRVSLHWNCTSSPDTLRFCQGLDSLQTRSGWTVITNPIDVFQPVDIDRDGDLDLLLFDAPGARLRWYRNIARDSFQRTDTLILVGPQTCFGKMMEDPFTCIQYLDTCAPIWLSPRHAGSTLAWVYLDRDTFPDLLLADVTCPWVSALYLYRSGQDSDFVFIRRTDSFPPGEFLVMQIFPAVYPVDLTGDAQTDLLVAPAFPGASWDHFQIFALADTCLDPDTACFAILDSFYITREMLDFGRGSIPTVVDADQDGRPDILVGVWERRSPQISLYFPSVAFLKQVGPASAPGFALASWQWDTLYMRYSFPMMVLTFGDLDADGDLDAILGEASGNLFYLENTAGPGNPIHLVMKEMFVGDVDVGQASHPVLWDMDGDGDLDLLVGTREGRIVYLQNTGSLDSPVFVLTADTFAGIHVRLPDEIQGFSAPTIGYLDTSGVPYLIVGSWQGWLYIYRAVDSCLENGVVPVDTLRNLRLGRKVAPALADLNQDGVPELVIGSLGGGLRILSWGQSASPGTACASRTDSTQPGGIVVIPLDVQVSWYGSDHLVLTVSVPDTLRESLYLQILDAVGRQVYARWLPGMGGIYHIPLSVPLPPALYWISVRNAQGTLLLRKSLHTIR